MMHIVLIPTMKMDQALELANFLLDQEEKPDEIYIVDNSPDNKKLRDRKPLFFLDFGRNIGVNASWNCGLSLAKPKNAHLTILNDDIKVKPNFFGKIKYLFCFEEIDDVGVICPKTLSDLEEFNKFDPRGIGFYHVSKMSKREGWAFTIPSHAVHSIRPIPKELFIFCGDDWIWRETVIRNDFMWVKHETNVIYHAVGASKLKEAWIVEHYKREKKIWAELQLENTAMDQ